MSLYALGKAVGGNQSLESLERCVGNAGASLSRTPDPDDVRALDELVPSPGVAFAIVDRPGDTDATGLWNEVTLAAVRWHEPRLTVGLHHLTAPSEDYFEAISTTPLAKLCCCLIAERSFDLVCLAFVDGGIESVWRGSGDNCYREMAWEWRLPWDQTSNRLYVWSPKQRTNIRDAEEPAEPSEP